MTVLSIIKERRSIRRFRPDPIPAELIKELKEALDRYNVGDVVEGAISGMVGLAGGLGGFVLPIMFGALMDLTGIRSSAFMLLYGVVWVSLIWMYWTEVRRQQVMGTTATEFSLQN